jgi:hypothetical protein
VEKEFYMLRFVVLALAGALTLSAGCKSEPAPPAPKPPEAPPEKHIQAVEPRDGGQEVTLTPTFTWRLPSALGAPRLVSFTLSEFGQTAPPPKPGAEGKQIAFASGLHDVSPTSLDPFHPPAGVVLTGDLRDSKQLKGDTWYRWKIRALGEDKTEQAGFLFRTRAAEPGQGK